ncbi:oligosaccharide flippase family protein [Methylotenera sp.]|uniref:oligosaccharide flippase family protein n=1 Tax=Methylotenera sp. TaxID=2051956 RepID=UPI00248A62AF|nr:oligosaccharide flippase family protein [Methylotenera sp.]MDI1297806.1 oligosaccharide flippase family protein [Methylotenera sp.]
MSKSDSVVKGGGSVAIARMLGMVLSFLLFLVLARHSPQDAGVFRTVVTYLVIAEFLGMLGMHRWLATEMASENKGRWALFLATNSVMLGVSIFLIITYLSISYLDVYSPGIDHGLKLAALSIIPSGIYQCVQSALIGVGKTYAVGKYNGIEYLIRCTVSILLIYLNFSVTDVIWVFVLTRWGIAFYSFYVLSQMLEADHWLPNKKDVAYVLRDAPKFLVIIFAFLTLRNAALVLIPALISDAENAIFGVAYQLFDMILLIPSVLAVTSNHVFVNKANQSNVALRRVSTQLVSITSLALFPCIAITAAFAQNFLMFLYGDHYLLAKHALMLLMIASGLVMVDQVLSQVMTARKDYKSDMISILVGGLSAAALTVVLVMHSGATGAALALVLAMLATVIIRLRLLRSVFPIKLLLLSTWRPSLASLITFIFFDMGLKLSMFSVLANGKYLWIFCVPIALILYVFLLYVMGGITLAKRTRIRQFLFHH